MAPRASGKGKGQAKSKAGPAQPPQTPKRAKTVELEYEHEAPRQDRAACGLTMRHYRRPALVAAAASPRSLPAAESHYGPFTRDLHISLYVSMAMHVPGMQGGRAC